MFYNNLLVLFRNLARYKAFSLINLLGLSVALTCVLAIGLYVADEYSFDRYHEKVDRIYQVTANVKRGDGQAERWSATPNKVVPTIAKDIPEVEKAARLFHHNFGDLAFVSTDAMKSSERFFFWADPELFDIITVPFVAGDTKGALSKINTVVISESSAKKYFNGNEQAIGKMLKVDNKIDLEVIGVFRDQPANSQFPFQMIAAFQSNWFGRPQSQSWGNASFQSLLLLHSNASPADVDVKLEKMLTSNIPKEDRWYTLSLTPLKDLHLYSSGIKKMSGATAGGDVKQIKILGLLGLVVLLIAAFNYMNLSTAQAQRRAKEIGINKTLGASRYQLAFKFFFETFSFVLIAMTISVMLFLTLLPLFNMITGKLINSAFLAEPIFWTVSVILLFVLSLIAGLYPAFYLSSFAPKSVLKSAAGVKGYPLLRKTLVVLQFSASIVLIICTIGLYRQLQFIQSKNLGYKPEQVVSIRVSGAGNRDKVNAVKTAFESLARVSKVCKAQAYPGQGASGRTLLPMDGKGEGISISTNRATPEILDVLNIQLLAGKTLPEKQDTDTTIQVVVNKTCVDFLGLTPEEAIGKQARIFDGQRSEIVGVMEDFHTESLYQPIEAYCFHNAQSETYASLLVKIQADDVRNTMASLQETYDKIVPTAFEYVFIDQYLQKLYESDNRLAKIVMTFSSIAIIIACLGLYALASYSTEQRTKEIGIRKVMGASVMQISNMLSQDFIKLVLISVAIAIPASFYFLNQWMQQFAYRTSLSVLIFAAAGLVSLLLAWFTVGLKTWYAAQANPVDSLRNE
ncbi:ABC transporter permease [Cytophagales bacterium WSM2-2]|nr:ABC transporter permease [Cytophagales bacterium WSM2-2]